MAKMPKILKKLLWMLLAIFGIYLAAVLIGSFITNGSFTLTRDAFLNAETLGIFGIGVAFYGLLKLMQLGEKAGGGNKPTITPGKDREGKDQEQYYDKRFMKDSELENNSDLNFCTFNTILKKENDGILMRAHKKNKDLLINYINPIHTLVIGTTGSGKTTQYLMPTMQIMCRTKSKPSFVVSDPKGELMDGTYEALVEQGYDIKVYNLAEPFSSMKWNPMELAYDLYKRAHKLEDEIVVHPVGDNIDPTKVVETEKIDTKTQSWYEFNKRAYVNKGTLFNDMDVRKKELSDEAMNELNDFCSVLAPTLDKNQPGWENGARGFILGVAQGMLEDSTDSRLGMTREKFNPYNLYRICQYRDNGRDQFSSLKRYFQNRDKFSTAPTLATTVLSAPENTLKSYLSVLNEKLIPFSDKGVCLCTSKTEINFREIARKPTAFFLRIPDYIHTRDMLATICFSQIYKQLIAEARSFELPGQSAKLKRNVYFLLDEFANMPQFPAFGSVISVARSRKIFYVLVIQSYSQLRGKYGEQDASVIFDNTPVTIYCGTNDLKTNEEFSRSLGNRTIEITQKTESGGGGTDKKSNSTSKNAVSIPLIDAQKLPTINAPPNGPFNLIATYYQFVSPIMTEFTPIYKAKEIYNMRAPRIPYRPIEALNEDKIYYDISVRNKIVESGAKSNDDDDFPF